MKYGPERENINRLKEASYAAGRSLVTLDKEPSIYIESGYILEGFMMLNTCRPLGLSEGPIPWTAIRDYVNEIGLKGTLRSDFFYFIYKMDDAYLEFKSKKTDS